MSDPHWGLLGPSIIPAERRTRTLGLAGAVRDFNDRAVPGMGGVWFGKQLFLAVLGVAVADRLRGQGFRNVAVGNAIEALACWSDFVGNGWRSDPRLVGSTKLKRSSKPTFERARTKSFYVTNPLRPASVQPLAALNLVETSGERFNMFHTAEFGIDLIEYVIDGYRPYGLDVLSFLTRWASGGVNHNLESPQLKCLWPTLGMPLLAREFVRERIIDGSNPGAERRASIMGWFDSSSSKKLAWGRQPARFSDDHWRDLHGGALFFNMRDAALALLDKLEYQVASVSDQEIVLDLVPPGMDGVIDALRRRANEYRSLDAQGSELNTLGSEFSRECLEVDDPTLLINMVRRDARVLRLRGNSVIPGPAFGRQSQAVMDPEEEVGGSQRLSGGLTVPEGTSPRVHQMFLLDRDLSGEQITEPSEHAEEES